MLLEVIANELTRLRELKKRLDPIDRLDRASAQERAMFDGSKEGALLRRYETACEREFHKAIADLMKLRKGAASRPEPEPEGPPLQNEAIAEIISGEPVASIGSISAGFDAFVTSLTTPCDGHPTPAGAVPAPSGSVPVDV